MVILRSSFFVQWKRGRLRMGLEKTFAPSFNKLLSIFYVTGNLVGCAHDQ